LSQRRSIIFVDLLLDNVGVGPYFTALRRVRSNAGRCVDTGCESGVDAGMGRAYKRGPFVVGEGLVGREGDCCLR
jgi:hypothetical protein